LTHVLEHLEKGVKLVEDAARKLRKGGIMYVAYPSPRSVTFPSRRGTLNFYDDPTHITIIRKDELLEVFRRSGMEVVFAGMSRSIRGLLLMLARILMSPALGGVTGPVLWDLYGFEEIAVGRLSRTADTQSKESLDLPHAVHPV
jgi:hypothetical protein